MNKLLPIILFTLPFLASCNQNSYVSKNISIDAGNFKINRRIVFYNGITGKNILTIEGLCSLDNVDHTMRSRPLTDSPKEVSITCKVGEDSYKKHLLGLSDNVTYFAEQIDPSTQDTYFYKVITNQQD